MHEFEHAGSFAGAEVELVAAGPSHGVPQRSQVPVGEVDDVDVIAKAGPVRRRVVAAENVEVLPASDGHLRDEGHQIVRDAGRILADLTMRPDRIEIPQQAHRPVVVGDGDVGQDLLHHQLGAAVRIRRAEGGVLPDRNRIRIPVHGCRGTEHDGAYTRLEHGLQQNDRSADVVVVVRQWSCDRFPDGFHAGEVDDRIDAVLGEQLVQQCAVADISGDVTRTDAGDALDPAQHAGLGIGEVVDDDRLDTGFDELHDGVAADVAGPAGDKNCHELLPRSVEGYDRHKKAAHALA